MILTHVSRTNNLKVLEPRYDCRDTGKKAICFSINEFSSHFGEYVYIFEYKILSEHYKIIKKKNPESTTAIIAGRNGRVHINSKDKLEEYRIYEPVDCKYCLGVLKHYNESNLDVTNEIHKLIEKAFA